MKTVGDLIMNLGHFQMRCRPQATQHPNHVNQVKAEAAQYTSGGTTAVPGTIIQPL